MELKRESERTRPLPAFFYRLSSARQRVYLRSDAIDRLPLAPSVAALDLARTLMRAIDGQSLPAVGEGARALVRELCRLLGVATVAIEVRGVRPHNARGELHGIFYPSRPMIVLWMRTAQRHEVVKPRTFLRTLLHEVGHYLDYSLLKLGDSFHTGGFFRRESFLVSALYPPNGRVAPGACIGAAKTEDLPA